MCLMLRKRRGESGREKKVENRWGREGKGREGKRKKGERKFHL